MLTVTLAGVIAAISLMQDTDTTIQVREGMRLDLENREGEIRITAWQRDEVRIVTGRMGYRNFTVDQSGSVLRIRPAEYDWEDTRDRRRRRDDWDEVVDFDVTVPVYLALDLSGIEVDIIVDGVEGDITAHSVEGEVRVRGGTGFISLRSVEGDVMLEEARGRIDVSSVDGSVILRHVEGELTAESVDGDIELDRVESRSVVAGTVDGDITYDGTITDGGRYELSTHDGDVRAFVPAEVNATVSVATFDGEFETNFPIVLREAGRRRFTFTLGNGSAVVELESFDGSIFLRRGR